MKTSFRVTITACLLLLADHTIWAVAPIEPPELDRKGARSEPETASGQTENQPRVFEFSGDEIGVVLRSVARQAKMNIVVSPSVKGTVTLRLEDKTPRETILVICKANDLEIQELNGVHYIRAWDDLIKADAKKMAHVVKLMVDAYMEKGFSRAEAMELIRTPSLPRVGVPAPVAPAKPSRR